MGGAALLILIGVAALFLMNNSDPAPDRVIAHPEQTAPGSPEPFDTLGTDGVPDIQQPVVTTSDPDEPDSPVDLAPRPGPGETVATADATIAWSSIGGLLAIRDDQQPDWRGVRGAGVLNVESELALLPGSRAEGRFPGGVRILLDDDSRLSLVPDPGQPGLPILSLEWGRLALFDLKEGTTLPVPLPLASSSENLRIDRDGTSFAVERTGDGGRLVIAAGALSLDGRHLDQGFSIAWDSDAGSPNVVAAVPPGWLLSGAPAPVADHETLAMLEASGNLLQDMETTLRAASASDVDTIVDWSLALSPESALLSSLNSEAHVVRVAALNWLADAPPDDPRRGTAWRAFAGSLEEPETAQQIVSWFRAAREPAHTDRQLFAELLGGLEHTSVAVRETADFCLRRITRVDGAEFRADADPPERRQGVRRWRQIVARIAGGRPGGAEQPERRGGR